MALESAERGSLDGWAAGRPVSRETMDRLGLFAELLTHWNRSVNLIAPDSLPDLWRRHIDDSCQLVSLMPPNAKLAADFGSGAGLPGLVLCIATGLPFLLVESDRRKAAFLIEAARITQAPATILPQRAETLRCRVDVVTARAVAPLARLLEWTHPILHPDGACLFLKGRNAGAELSAAETRWRMTVDRVASVTSPDSSILVLKNLARR